MTRKEAKALGLKTYKGKICLNGHTDTTRYTGDGRCIACLSNPDLRANAVQRMTQWKADNPERRKKLAAAYRKRHRTKLQAKSVAYRKANPTDKLIRVVREARRRARKAKSNGQYTKADVLRLKELQRGKCAYCAISLKAGFSVDHILPMVLNGHSNPTNLQLLCKSCNSSKGGKHPVDFARYIGLLI